MGHICQHRKVFGTLAGVAVLRFARFEFVVQELGHQNRRDHVIVMHVQPACRRIVQRVGRVLYDTWTRHVVASATVVIVIVVKRIATSTVVIVISQIE